MSVIIDVRDQFAVAISQRCSAMNVRISRRMPRISATSAASSPDAIAPKTADNAAAVKDTSG